MPAETFDFRSCVALSGDGVLAPALLPRALPAQRMRDLRVLPHVRQVSRPAPALAACNRPRRADHVPLRRVGVKWFADNRKMVMLVTAFLSFICIILSLVAVVGLSTTQDDIKATAWTYGEVRTRLRLHGLQCDAMRLAALQPPVPLRDSLKS